MAFHDPYTPARDDWTHDDIPGWTPRAEEELQRKPHDVRLAERLALRDREFAQYPDGMTRPDGSKQGDRDD